MAICNHCVFYEHVLSDAGRMYWKCAIRHWQIIIPECLQNWETRQILRDDRCKYFKSV